MCAKRTVRPIPEETASAGQAFFKKGSFYRAVGDQLGDLCKDFDQEDVGATEEKQVTIPLLFLVTIFQYLESMSDSQAAAALLNRVDWKYALHLPLVSLGFDQKGFDDYHRKLQADPTVLKCMNDLLDRVRQLYESPGPGSKKVNTAKMLAAVHTLNQLSQLVRSMRLALEELAIYHPFWLKRTVLPHWFQRYSRGGTESTPPSTHEKRESLALAVGADGFFLLDALDGEGAPSEARKLPEVEYLRLVWSRQFARSRGKVKWVAAAQDGAGEGRARARR